MFTYSLFVRNQYISLTTQAMSQQKQITSSISNAKVDKLSIVNTKKRRALNLANVHTYAYLVPLITAYVLKMRLTRYKSH